MAINKSNTSPLMKTLIILLAASFVIGIGGLSVLSTCSPNAPLLPNGSTTAGSTDTTAQVQAINLRSAPEIQAREASITADPKNYDLLVAQANAYSDWASQVLAVTQPQQTAADVTLWTSAVPYYERALKVKPGDPNVETDYSIALFYSGAGQKAIDEAIAIRKANPTFAPVLFNLGIYYASTGSAGDIPKAEEAFQAYLKLAPTGNQAANAKDALAKLAASTNSGSGTTSSVPGTATTP